MERAVAVDSDMVDKRYQVFVSSTFQDLQEERQQVIQALLELDCIPSGMELFPAADEDQWTLIKRVIDDCDYYLVIIGGRYGSLAPSGMSYTEMEYRYALEKGKPIIGFLHPNPGELPANRCEDNPEKKAKLEEFRTLVQKKVVKFWKTPQELGSVISRSVVNLIKTRPAIGWVRADQVADEVTAQEVLRLKRQIEELKGTLEAQRHSPPAGTERLAKGTETFVIDYSFRTYTTGIGYRDWTASCEMSWDVIFAAVAPSMIDEISDDDVEVVLNALIESRETDGIRERNKLKGVGLSNFQITASDFDTIKVQLRALGLITKSVKPRSVKDTGTYWSLTPYGDTVMTSLVAIESDQADDGTPPEAQS